jgi:dethiobiotin synthetase
VRGLFVTGTDTGVGKTVLSAALLAAMAAAGEPVAACKPVLTGVASTPDPDAWPSDDELLAGAYGGDPHDVTSLRFAAAASPHLAAALEGRTVDPAALVDGVRDAATGGQTLVVEGVGGLLVPLCESFDVCDLAADLGLPVVVAARPGLGTINHTLLTLMAARGRGLHVRAVVLTPWPAAPDAVARSNLQTIAALGTVEVAVLATVAQPCRDELAAAGAALPWRSWLAPEPRANS